MPRTALIVDDSRVALTTLKRLLQEHGIPADTVESGHEALDYLRGNAPSMIFLDHMMPGMDGFETLAAIKANRQTATIPVIMYTSQEGEAYMAHALTQGAVGVLHKPTNPVALTQILHRVERRPIAAVVPPPHAPAASRPAREAPVTGVREIPPALSTSVADTSVTPVPKARARWVRYAALVFLLLLPSAWLYHRDQESERRRLQLEQENRDLKAAEANALAQIESANSQRSALDTSDQREAHALLKTVAWAFNRHGQYSFGKQALDDNRLVQVRELVQRLAAAGFHGTLQIAIHSGEFCLQRDAQGESHLPRANLPLSLCDIRVQASEPAVQLGLQESAAFAQYLAAYNDDSVPIRIQVISRGTGQPLIPYPEAESVATAGEWNRVAAQNQRVEIALVPGP